MKDYKQYLIERIEEAEILHQTQLNTFNNNKDLLTEHVITYLENKLSNSAKFIEQLKSLNN